MLLPVPVLFAGDPAHSMRLSSASALGGGSSSLHIDNGVRKYGEANSDDGAATFNTTSRQNVFVIAITYHCSLKYR